MKLRALIWIVVCGVALLASMIAGLIWYSYGRETTLRLSEEKLQQSLDAVFPIEKTHLLIFKLRYKNPRVRLEDGSDRVKAGLDAETAFTVNEQTFSGSALASGKVLYDPSSGAFFLTDPRIESMTIKGIPEKYSDKVDEVGSILLRHYLEKKPIYQLRDGDVKQAFARLVLKRVRVKDRHLEIVMGIGP